MGMSCSAAIIVGLHRAELEDHENFGDFENGSLDQAPPYYDGGFDAIFGVIAVSGDDYSAIEVNGSIDSRISAAKDFFKAKTGLDGRVYITPVIW